MLEHTTTWAQGIVWGLGTLLLLAGMVGFVISSLVLAAIRLDKCLSGMGGGWFDPEFHWYFFRKDWKLRPLPFLFLFVVVAGFFLRALSDQLGAN